MPKLKLSPLPGNAVEARLFTSALNPVLIMAALLPELTLLFLLALGVLSAPSKTRTNACVEKDFGNYEKRAFW